MIGMSYTDTMQPQEHKKRSNRRPWQIAGLLGVDIQAVIKACSEIGVLAEENTLLGVETRDAIISLISRKKAADRLSSKSASPKSAKKTAGKEPKPRYKSALPKIGSVVNTEHVDYLGANSIRKIHEVLTEHFKTSKDPIEPPGVRDENLLESAASRPHTGLDREKKYPTIPYIGAAYLHSIIGNHPFHNGNKRTAFVSLLSFLESNKFVFYDAKLSEDEMYQILVDIANKKLRSSKETYDSSDREVIRIAEWLNSKLRHSNAKDPILKWVRLQNILNHYDCTISSATRGNAWNIERKGRKTQVNIPNDGHDVDRNTMKRIRTDLGLMPADGVESFIFYGKEEAVPAFIQKYKILLNKLAKT